MSEGHIYLYVLRTLLCVCVVMCDGNHTETFNISTTVASDTDWTNASSSLGPSLTTSFNPDVQNYTADTESSEDVSTVTTTVSEDEDYNSTTSHHSEPTGPSDHPQTSWTSISTASVTAGSSSSSGSSESVGVVFLILILIIIIALAVILYILWKKGRSYSFDLTNPGNDHDTPLRSMEHGGTFEPTTKELSLDYIQEEKPQETSPTVNGCAGDTTKQEPPAEQQNVPEEDSYMSDTSQTPPIKKVEFNLDLDLLGGESDLVDQAEAETSEARQNENNNNVTTSENDSLDLFTEINLDEPQ